MCEVTAATESAARGDDSVSDLHCLQTDVVFISQEPNEKLL